MLKNLVGTFHIKYMDYEASSVEESDDDSDQKSDQEKDDDSIQSISHHGIRDEEDVVAEARAKKSDNEATDESSESEPSFSSSKHSIESGTDDASLDYIEF